MAEVEIQSERGDDIPLLVQQQHKMGIAEIIDASIKPLWRRQGLSVGNTVLTWLTFILSEADHRMSYVEPWVAKRLETLKRVITQALTVHDFNDDRLGDVHPYLSDDQSWRAIEQTLGQQRCGSTSYRRRVCAWIAPPSRCTMTQSTGS